MNIFPGALVRIAGNSFDGILDLEFRKPIEYLKRAVLLNEILQSEKILLCDELYKLISGQSDTKIQNILLNIKRDIFNDRDISEAGLEVFLNYSGNELKNKYASYKDLLIEYNSKKNEFDSSYNIEIFNIREKFKDLVNDDILLEGLILSSQSLLKRARSFLGKSIKSYNKDDYRTELSLLKYLSRIYTKTSPFGKFTNLCFAGISEKPELNANYPVLIRGSKKRIISSVKLNNFIGMFLVSLILKNRSIYVLFPLKANPTIHIKDNTYIYLTNFTNIESFQRIPVDEVLEMILDKIRTNPDGKIYEHLIKEILEEGSIDATVSDLENYIDQLLEYGFLEFNTGISGINHGWDIQLIESLKKYAGGINNLDEIVNTLVCSRELINDYECALTDKKEELLLKIYTGFEKLCRNLAETSLTNGNSDKENNKEENGYATDQKFRKKSWVKFNFKPEQMIYEDSILENPAEISSEEINTITESLSFLLNSSSFFNGITIEMEKMKYFYKEFFRDQGSVNVLNFYEEYYKEAKKTENQIIKQFSESNLNNKFEDNSDNQFIKIFNEITANRINTVNNHIDNLSGILLNNKLINRDLVNIQRKHLLNRNNSNNTFPLRHSSYCSYIQFVKLNNSVNGAVINLTTSGYGKMYSRFLHLFDSSITEKIIDFNNKISNNNIFAECTDSSVFNANLHPALMPKEIKIPGGQNNHISENQIEIKDLQVTLDEKTGSLKLVHVSTGKDVYLFDLCFQNLLERSNLYQLLSQFTISKNQSYSWILSAVNNSVYEQDPDSLNFRQYPRIIFDDKLVLQRKFWIIQKNTLPYRSPSETSSEYFLKLTIWRKKFNIDDEVFINFAENSSNKLSTDKYSKDDYKPQYINFKNPLLVNLFAKNLEKVDKELRIVEMLPGSSELYQFNNKKYITEYVVQWYE